MAGAPAVDMADHAGAVVAVPVPAEDRVAAPFSVAVLVVPAGAESGPADDCGGSCRRAVGCSGYT